MRATVFDSYALLELFFDQPAAGHVEDLLREAAAAGQPILISAVNWAEVLYRMQREEGEAGLAAAKRFGVTMPLEIVPVDLPLAEQAAEYKASNKMSLADAFAAALAKHRKAALVTGDPDFKSVEKQIKIEWLK